MARYPILAERMRKWKLPVRIEKVWLVEEVNIDYEFHHTKIICSSKDKAEQKAKEYTQKELEANKGRPSWVNSNFYVKEWELDKEKNIY